MSHNCGECEHFQMPEGEYGFCLRYPPSIKYGDVWENPKV